MTTNAPGDPDRQRAGLPPQPGIGRRKRLWRRLAVLFLIVFVLALAGTELFARYYLGLGDPPLSMTDPKMEYIFKPNQTCHRFGHLIHYNAYSMRSDDFPEKKQDPAEFRVLMVGDSVINGGSLTDQTDTVTSILQRRLAKDLGRKTLVMNVSAGSWGPPNELEYVKKFGFFDADIVVLELASHDYADAPTFEPLVGVNPAFPEHKPLFALQEAISRYLLPRLLHRSPPPDAPTPGVPPGYPVGVAKQSDIDWCRDSEREFFKMAQARGKPVLLLQYWEKKEMTGTLMPGYAANRAVAEAESVPVVNVGPAFVTAIKQGTQPFRDSIHPNVQGNQLMTDALAPAIEKAVGMRDGLSYQDDSSGHNQAKQNHR